MSLLREPPHSSDFDEDRQVGLTQPVTMRGKFATPALFCLRAPHLSRYNPRSIDLLRQFVVCGWLTGCRLSVTPDIEIIALLIGARRLLHRGSLRLPLGLTSGSCCLSSFLDYVEQDLALPRGDRHVNTMQKAQEAILNCLGRMVLRRLEETRQVRVNGLMNVAPRGDFFSSNTAKVTFSNSFVPYRQ